MYIACVLFYSKYKFLKVTLSLHFPIFEKKIFEFAKINKLDLEMCKDWGVSIYCKKMFITIKPDYQLLTMSHNYHPHSSTDKNEKTEQEFFNAVKFFK